MNVLEASAIVGLVIATATIHAWGLFSLLRALLVVVKRRSATLTPAFTVRVLSTLTLASIVLHLVEVALWAVFYRTVAGFSDWRTALSFSLGSYSTVGAAVVTLPEEWRLLAPLEAMTGALMFGLSAAFLFTVLNEIHYHWRDSARRPAGS